MDKHDKFTKHNLWNAPKNITWALFKTYKNKALNKKGMEKEKSKKKEIASCPVTSGQASNFFFSLN